MNLDESFSYKMADRRQVQEVKEGNIVATKADFFFLQSR